MATVFLPCTFASGGELLLHSHSSHANTHLAVHRSSTTTASFFLTLVHLVIALLSCTQASDGRLCRALAMLLR